MNKHTEEQLILFMSVLIDLGLTKDQVCGICSFLKTEEMAMEMLNRLEEKDFKTTPQETMNICCKVIKENL